MGGVLARLKDYHREDFLRDLGMNIGVRLIDPKQDKPCRYAIELTPKGLIPHPEKERGYPFVCGVSGLGNEAPCPYRKETRKNPENGLAQRVNIAHLLIYEKNQLIPPNAPLCLVQKSLGLSEITIESQVARGDYQLIVLDPDKTRKYTLKHLYPIGNTPGFCKFEEERRILQTSHDEYSLKTLPDLADRVIGHFEKSGIPLPRWFRTAVVVSGIRAEGRKTGMNLEGIAQEILKKMGDSPLFERMGRKRREKHKKE
ncbi:MAG: hypothetical protein ABIH34_07610 [Nanoarchaeota archaeon]